MADQGGNIKTFTAGDGPALNTDKANEAATQLSRSAALEGGYYRQAGEDYKQAGKTLGDAIDNHEYMNEVSTGAAAGAALSNNKLKEWQQIATQPGAVNDKNLQQNFLDNNLEPALQQYENGFSTERGQKWAIEQTDRMWSDFFHTTSADIMNLTGEQRIRDATTVANQNGDIVRRDPAQADAAISHITAYTDGLKAGLSPEKAVELDKFKSDQVDEIAKIQVMSLADKGNFDAAKAALDTQGKAGNIDAKWQEQLVGYISNQKIARQVQAQQARDEQQYKDQQMNEKTTHDIFSDMVGPNGNIISATTAFSAKGLSPQQRTDLISPDKNNPGILNLPRKFLTSTDYGPGFASTAESIQRGDGVTAAGLTKGIRMYGNPETANQSITPAGAARLQEIQDKMKTPQGAQEVQMQNSVLDDMKDHLMPAGQYANDPKGKAIYAGIQNSFYTLWDSEIKSGKTPAQLADPESKDYIGNAFMSLKRSPAQAMSDIVNAKPETAPQKVVLPPADKREVGKTYPTARGPMVWQEGGWAQPKAEK